MLGEHHSLAHEFPEYKDQIHELKVNKYLRRISGRAENQTSKAKGPALCHAAAGLRGFS
jgi:hypothetical protein